MKIIQKLVSRNMKLNKKRTTVTIIGIILSVAMLSALSILVSSLRYSLIEYAKNKDGDYHVEFTGVMPEDIETFANNRKIESMYFHRELGYAILSESKNQDKPYAYLLATNEDGFSKSKFQLTEGRFPENENELVIAEHARSNGKVDIKLGDQISLAVGQRISIDSDLVEGDEEIPLMYDIALTPTRGKDQSCPYGVEAEAIANPVTKSYKVVGVMKRPGFVVEPYSAPGYTFFTYEDRPQGKSKVFARLTLKGLRSLEEPGGEILRTDEASFTQLYNARLISLERIWPMDRDYMVVGTLAVVVALIIILTSIYCIKNSFEISVTEKVQQFGMLASVGATKGQIAKCVHLEAAFMGLIGIPTGVLSGGLASYILVQVADILLKESLSFGIVYQVSGYAILISILLGIITIYFSASKSARKAGKVSPIEAIRNQREIKLGKKLGHMNPLVKRLWGIGGVISYKNIKRNHKKYRTTTVSIGICIVTFIVISYFLSMFLQLTGLQYANEACDLRVYLDGDVNATAFLEEVDNLENIEAYVMTKTGGLYIENPKYSKEYERFASEEWLALIEDEFIQVVGLDQESFTRYANACNILNPSGKGILMNHFVGSKENKRFEMEMYDYKAKDKLTLYDFDERLVEEDEDGRAIPESKKLTKGEITLAGVTTKAVMGYENRYNPVLFVSMEDYEKLPFVKENAYKRSSELLFLTEDAQKLEDQMTTILHNMAVEGVYMGAHSMYNRQQNMRQEKALFTLLGIFAYGFIAVIALIGITNIINTLETSLELRSRDFAILRSVGMTDKQFLRMIRLESLFTGGKACFYGVLIGFLISAGIWKYECMYDTDIIFHPPIQSALISVAAVMILVYAIIRNSLTKINKRNIIETIKNENH